MRALAAGGEAAVGIQFNKVRYRGLAKNTARAYTAFALANLYLLRKRLLPSEAKCAL